jgi:uncharacterized protein
MIYLFFIAITGLLLLFAWYQMQFFLVFQPHKYPRESLDKHFTPLSIVVSDKTLLEGIEYAPEQFEHTLVYIGGKYQDSVALIQKLAVNFPFYRIVTYNHRGYGDSQGHVNEKVFYKDALEVAKKFTARYGIYSLLGYSLGSSAAAFVASHVSVEHLFLIGAFDSIEAMFTQRGVPAFLVRYRFDTAVYMQNVSAKTCLVVSTDDQIIPIKRSRYLRDKIKNLAWYKELSGYNHNEILLCKESKACIEKVLK